MKKGQNRSADNVAPVCGVGEDGMKCAVVSWAAPLAAAVVLVAGFYYPVVSAFNIIFVAFGIAATLRSLAHIRTYGACGLGGHIIVGVLLNVVVITLVALYIFTSFDPLSLRR